MAAQPLLHVYTSAKYLPEVVPAPGQIAARLGYPHPSLYKVLAPVAPEAFTLCRAVPGIFVAGGVVAAAIHTFKPKYRQSADAGDWAYTSVAAGDIDVYATGNREEKMATIARLVAHLQPHSIVRTQCAITMFLASDRIPRVLDMFSTEGTITLGEFWPTARRIQVILDPAPTMEAVLESYDLDCCCCATDGKSYFLSQRCVDAHTTQCNRFNPLVTPARAAKYMCRGYDLVGAPEKLVAQAAARLNVGAGLLQYVPTAEEGPASSYEGPLALAISVSNSPHTVADKVLSSLKRSILSGDAVPFPWGRTTVGCGDEATFAAVVASDAQPPITLSDWLYAKLNEVCEISELYTYGGERAATIRNIIAEDMESVAAAIAALRMPPVYSEGISSIRQRLQQQKNAK